MDPPPARPVCRYDGQCYRKNETHFRAYAHPKQRPDLDGVQPVGPASPVPAAAAPIVSLGQDTPTDPETPVSHTAAEEEDALVNKVPSVCAPATPLTASSPARAGSESESDSLESGAPSLDLLQLLMQPSFQPHPQHVGLETAAHHSPSFAVADLYPALSGAGAYARQLYGGTLAFHGEDICAVLLAAMKLSPQAPLTAFPGWRLVGPLEAVHRAYLHAQQLHKTAPTSPPASTWFDPFASEAARWRCARYRHDPPECQTVAVDVAAATATASTSCTLPPLHVCYHRDDPDQPPSLLVQGGLTQAQMAAAAANTSTTELPKEAYVWSPVSTCLTAFLLGAARDRKDVAAETALMDAIQQVTSTGAAKAMVWADPAAVGSLAQQAKAMTGKRTHRALAATIHGLGIVAPYDKKTELGYRPLMMSRAHLMKLLLGWDRHFKLWCTHLQANCPDKDQDDATADNHPPLKAARLETQHAATGGTGNMIFSMTSWTELQEQFRYADMGNDEGDYGLNMELGMDLFSMVHTECLSDPPAPSQAATAASSFGANHAGAAPVTEEMTRGVSPNLWQTFRVLDCAYMLLGRDLFRHVLRCHVPMLAGLSPMLSRPPIETATDPQLWAPGQTH